MRSTQQHIVVPMRCDQPRLGFWRELAGSLRPSARQISAPIAAHASDDRNATLQLTTLAAIQLLVFLTLFTFRQLDDNRLTSWQWVFDSEQLPYFTALIALGLLAAVPLSNLQFKTRVALALTLAAAVLVGALSWTIPEVNIDAARYFVQAKYLSEHGIIAYLDAWGTQLSVWTDLPLMPLLYGLALDIGNESRVAIQLLNTLLLGGSILAIYGIGCSLWNERVGLSAASMLLAFPFLFTQVPLMLVDLGAMFFLIASLYAAIEYLKHGGMVRLGLAAVCVTLALLSKYSTWPMVPALLLSTALLPIADRRQRTRRLAVVCVAVSVLMLPVVVLKFDVLHAQVAFLASYQVPGLQRWEENLLSTFLYQTHPLIALGVLSAAVAAIVKRDVRILAVSCVVLMLLLLDVRRIRYTIIVFPFLALMAGYALALVENRRIRNYLIVSAVISAAIITSVGYRGFLIETSAANLSRAGAFIDTLPGDDIEVHVLPQTVSQANAAVSGPLLDLATHKSVHVVNYQRTYGSVGESERATSPVRFSWEFDFEAAQAAEQTSHTQAPLVAVVFSSAEQAWPDSLRERVAGYREVAAFAHNDGIFKFQSMVKVLSKDGGVLQER